MPALRRGRLIRISGSGNGLTQPRTGTSWQARAPVSRHTFLVGETRVLDCLPPAPERLRMLR
eukprot:11016502-Heterocapsa_arctica.AAC.1